MPKWKQYLLRHLLYFPEVVFGVTIRGKTIALTWINVLLAHISPRSIHGRICVLTSEAKMGRTPITAMPLNRQGQEHPPRTVQPRVCTKL
jgi:hypothetical protein